MTAFCGLNPSLAYRPMIKGLKYYRQIFKKTPKKNKDIVLKTDNHFTVSSNEDTKQNNLCKLLIKCNDSEIFPDDNSIMSYSYSVTSYTTSEASDNFSYTKSFKNKPIKHKSKTVGSDICDNTIKRVSQNQTIMYDIYKDSSITEIPREFIQKFQVLAKEINLLTMTIVIDYDDTGSASLLESDKSINSLDSNKAIPYCNQSESSLSSMDTLLSHHKKKFQNERLEL